MILGFSTAFIDKISFLEKMNFFAKLGCNAFEVNLYDFERVEIMDKDLKNFDLSQFVYRAIHSPSLFEGKNVIFDNDDFTKKILERTKIFSDKFNFDTFVVHPTAIKDFSIFSQFDLPVAFENEDSRNKNRYRSLDDMKKLFSAHDVDMVLDVNHCFTNDKTMQLAEDMKREFGTRVKHVHLSGFASYHEPLFQTKQTEIVDSVINFDHPIIIESVCETLADHEAEYNYIKDYIYSHP